MMDRFQSLRNDIPLLGETTYLNTAQRGLTPQRLTEAACAAIRQYATCPPQQIYVEQKRRIRDLAARLLQVGACEIALISCTAEGLGVVASSLTWQPGDNVVIAEAEHGSNFFPWLNLRRLGVEIRLVPVQMGRAAEVEDYLPLIDDRTKVVAASLVAFHPGTLLDARRLADAAHAVGAWFVVDGIQAVGLTPVYPRELGIDALSAASYKGLMSIYGSGLLYLSRELQAKMHPAQLYRTAVVGNLGTGDVFADREYGLVQEARLYECGADQPAASAQLEQALLLIEELGIREIGQYVHRLATRLATGAVELGYKLDTPPDAMVHIVCLRLDDGQAVEAFLAERQIIVSVRRTGLRISLHAYNNDQDVDRILQALKEYPRRH